MSEGGDGEVIEEKRISRASWLRIAGGTALGTILGIGSSSSQQNSENQPEEPEIDSYKNESLHLSPVLSYIPESSERQTLSKLVDQEFARIGNHNVDVIKKIKNQDYYKEVLKHYTKEFVFPGNFSIEKILPAMIYVESTGNPNVISETGNVGLLQINPSYASEVLGRPISQEYLLDPKRNLETGIMIFNDVYEKFPDPAIALLVYHVGQGAGRNAMRAFIGEQGDNLLSFFEEQLGRDPFKATKVGEKEPVYGTAYNMKLLEITYGKMVGSKKVQNEFARESLLYPIKIAAAARVIG